MNFVGFDGENPEFFSDSEFPVYNRVPFAGPPLENQFIINSSTLDYYALISYF